ncbi:MAG: NAD(P)-binding domain-containing protein [Hyphomicrobiaceae bacterium]
MHRSSDQLKFAIIGAGASGLATAKNFRARGIPFEILEKTSDIGGLWNIATPSGVVYETTHLVSSARSTGFEDFPLPDHRDGKPTYPSHESVLAYFRAYADTFDLKGHIVFDAEVTRAEPQGDGTWRVQIKGEAEPRHYAGLVVANGHLTEPRLPKIPGDFAGTYIHSRGYKSPRQLRDKRIVVIGGGNSACDIVSDAAHNGAAVDLCLRRGYWFVPKFFIGFPTYDIVQVMEMIPFPRFVRRHLYGLAHLIHVGPNYRYGLQAPDYPIDAAHPTMSDEIPRLVSHGRVKVRPAIRNFSGNKVVFEDGSSVEADIVIAATGYQASMPFLDRAMVFGNDGRARFYENVFHQEHENLFAAGLIQANGSIWRLADYQSQLIASYLVAKQAKAEAAALIDAERRTHALPVGHFVQSERHKLEANYFDYRRKLRRLNRRFGTLATAQWPEPDRRPADPLRIVETSDTVRQAAE